MSRAKVFGDGDVTIVCNQVGGATRVYVGSRQIGLVQKLELRADADGQTSLEIHFPKSADERAELLIEENARAVAAFPWIKVVR